MVGVNAINGHASADYTVLEQPYEARRRIRVACIGAGFSGIYLALRLQQRCENVELTIFEKNPDLGGTWLENSYPGVACDVPAHTYCYTFKPKADWSSHYAPGKEILAYMRECADEFKARQFMRFDHQVVSAVWNEETALWDLIINNNGTHIQHSVEILVNAGGFLNSWKWPDIPGLENFQGKLLHTARWDETYDYRNKKVAVIGSGSSALQVVPSIQPDVFHLDAYIRSRTYIPEPLASAFMEQEHCRDYAGDRKYSSADIQKFVTDPDYFLRYRKTLEGETNMVFLASHAGTELNTLARNAALANMKKALAAKPELFEALAPTWDFGCRRPSPAIGFLEALAEDNVHVIKDEIDGITPDGIRTVDGKTRTVDAIVCATGFDVSWKPRFHFSGKGGFELDSKWAREPRSYCSIAIEHMPNYFIFNGPYSCGGNGNAVPSIEASGDYIIKCINKIQRQQIRSMTPQLKAIEEFSRHADAFMRRMAWSGGCRNWYRTASGRVVGTWPGSIIEYIQHMENPRWEDYDYDYNTATGQGSTNRFAYLGNGLTVDQASGTADLSPYLNNPVPAGISQDT